MRIDKAGRDDAAGGVIDRDDACKLLVGPLRLHRRDPTTGDPDLATAKDALGIGGEHPRIRDDEIGRDTTRGNIGKTTRHRV